MIVRPILVGLAASATIVAIGLHRDATAQKPSSSVKCSKAKIKSLWRASHGEFRIKQGLSEETRSGNIDRSKLKAKKGCQIEAKPGDTVLVVFDEKHKRKLRISSHFEMQCVDAVKPNGKFLGYDAAPQPSTADGKSWTPPCSAKGLNKHEKKVCSKGISNSDRHTRFRELTTKNKTFALDFYIREDPSVYSRSSEPYVGPSRTSVTAAEVAPSGRLFCQYFSKNDDDVLFSVTFDVPK